MDGLTCFSHFAQKFFNVIRAHLNIATQGLFVQRKTGHVIPSKTVSELCFYRYHETNIEYFAGDLLEKKEESVLQKSVFKIRQIFKTNGIYMKISIVKTKIIAFRGKGPKREK